MDLGEPFSIELRYKKKKIKCQGNCDHCEGCKEIKRLIKKGKLKPKNKEDKLKLLKNLEKIMKDRGISE